MKVVLKHLFSCTSHVGNAYSRVLLLLIPMVITFGLHGISKVCAVPTEPDDPEVIALVKTEPYALVKTEPFDVEIYKISPPKLPHIELECSVNAPDITMPAYHKMSTIEEFRDELKKLKVQYAPFLENKAPAVPSTRARLNISTFQFRMEKEPEDQQDIGRIFSGEGEWTNVAIPHYRGPNGWWKGYYRKVLDIPDDVLAQDTQILHFGAVSYFCDVYLNGRLVGSHTGWWAPFEIDLTPYLRRDGENVLVVEIRNESSAQAELRGESSAQHENNGRKIFAATSPGWDDPIDGWHCDQSGGGIWQTCYLEGRPKIHITDIFVQPNIDEGFIDTTIQVYQPPQYYQNGKHPRVSTDVDITVSIYPKNFNGAAIEDIIIPTPTPAGAIYSEYSGRIKLENFRQWDLETPYLYTIRATVQPKNGKGKPDCQDAHFGMRKFTMDEATTPKGTFYFNNREIILRGSNTMGHMQRAVMEGDLDQVVEDILIAKMANINYWRLTQRPVQPEIYDLCDKLGMLTQTDLPLFEHLSRFALEEAIKQAGEMELLVRNHPCNILNTFINETNLRDLDNRRFLNRQELERFFEAASQVIKIHNPDRVIKPIEGDFLPPPPGLPDTHIYSLWYGSSWWPWGQMHRGYSEPGKLGWKFGVGEYGTEGLDAAETMFKYYPKEWLPETAESKWKPDKIVRGQTWGIYPSWFDTQETMNQWIEASQNHQAFATRMMTRALRRCKNNTSSAVFYLIDAWPAGWMKALIDVDRIPKKAYFEYRDAITPLMVDIRTDRSRYFAGENLALEFWVCNDKAATAANGKLVWEVWQGEKRLFAQSTIVELPSYDPEFAGYFRYKTPRVSERTQLKIQLGLLDMDGNVLHATEEHVEIFPPFDRSRNRNRVVAIAGKRDGRAWKLAQQMGLEARLVSTGATKPTLVIVDTPEEMEQNYSLIIDYVKTGGTVLLLEQAQETVWRIEEQEIKVIIFFAKVGKEFVSRKTGHRLVKGFKPFDFAYWYNPELDYIDYLLDAYLDVEPQTKKLHPVLLTGRGPDMKLAVAEKELGKGSIIISQLKAGNRIECNPVAVEFYQRIINDAVSKQ